MTAKDYEESFEAVLEAEKEHLERGSEKEPLRGLAISGGGIRSASFGLGVLQALVNGRLLQRFDYLSTVSGGGYIGSCLTWFLEKGIPGPRPGETLKAGTSADDFPLGARGEPGARNAEGQSRNEVLNFIRQHGNYLMPGHGLDGSSLVAVALRGMLVSLSFYFGMLTVLMIVLHAASFFRAVPGFDGLFGGTTPTWFNAGMASAAVLLAVFALSSFCFSLLTYFSKGTKDGYWQRTSTQAWLGRILAAATVLAVLGSISFVHGELESAWSAAASGGLVGGGVLTGVLDHLQAMRSEGSKSLGRGLRPALGALALIYGIFLGAYTAAGFIIGSADTTMVTVLWSLLFVALAAVGWFVNTNYLGPHRMYRDRLMETFLPNQESLRENRWGLATDANKTGIQDVCKQNRRPYHLVNTNIILVDSPRAKFRGRSGDSFLLSPLFCGSDSTGWRRSTDFMNAAKGRGMTLATAMAISGAALNPNAGVAGRGPTTNRFVSTLLSMLCLRLGYWAPNPNREASPHKANLWSPGLRGGVISGRLEENQPWVELSDGGHFENLGIYELVRREADVIVVSDAGADPEFHFGDLANAVERCRVDFGALIVIPDGSGTERPLTDLIPGSGPETTLGFELAERGHAVGKIRYRSKAGKTKRDGTFIYIKTTMTEGLSADVYGYKNDHPEFPHQSTADQFFDEVQLEAYRELGYALGKKMCEDCAAWIEKGEGPSVAASPTGRQARGTRTKKAAKGTQSKKSKKKPS